MKNKIKMGFLGCGYMGQNAHLSNYTQLDGCEVVALCDTKARQAELVARRYGVGRVYTDTAAFLADLEIEAVVAAQYFENHVDLVPRILAAGKHLLTEKPLCVFPENARMLADTAAKAGKIHMVAYHKRSDPATEYARGVILNWKQTEKAGKMTYVRITMPPGDWMGGANRAISTDEAYGENTPEASPAGIDKATRERLVSFVNYYIHQVNLMRFLMDEDYKLTFADKFGRLLAAESTSGITGVLGCALSCPPH